MKYLLRHRRAVSELVHLTLAGLALAASFLLRFEFTLEPIYRAMFELALPILLLVKFLVFRAFSLRDLAWRYLGYRDLLRLALANLAASTAAAPVLRLAAGSGFPRSIHILDGVLCLMLMIGARGAVRALFDFGRARAKGGSPRRIAIYGAGHAGIAILNELAATPQMNVEALGFLDDDPEKRDLRIHGAKVLGRGAELAEIAARHRIGELWIAQEPGAGIARILAQCRAAGVSVKKVPALAERIGERVLLDEIRDVRLEDLLGRAPVKLDEQALAGRIAGRTILVTGAGGSIGSELCRQIARYQPEALVGFDHAETALYEIERDLREQFPRVRFAAEIGCIRDRRRLDELFREHAPQSVYHAAAYKHVPMMEAQIFEAVSNNVFGTRNLARAAMEAGVSDFVLISSDKAVRPANVMGATKRVAELVCFAAEFSRTEFRAVRFGNVLGSAGSVIPLFQKQIAAGGPVTVTHPGMRRFFMTIPEAAQLVLQAAALGAGGEIFVLEMGEPVRIEDLARNLILLSGLRPDHDIRIEYSGIRPGEKLYEELSAFEENTCATRHPQIRIFTGGGGDREAIESGLEELENALEHRDAGAVVMAVKELAPDYNPSSFVLRRAFQKERIGERARSVVA